jgi:hypothetical protein
VNAKPDGSDPTLVHPRETETVDPTSGQPDETETDAVDLTAGQPDETDPAPVEADPVAMGEARAQAGDGVVDCHSTVDLTIDAADLAGIRAAQRAGVLGDDMSAGPA